MKKIIVSVLSLFFISTLGFCDLITLDSTGESGSAKRRVKTYVDFEETDVFGIQNLSFKIEDYLCTIFIIK